MNNILTEASTAIARGDLVVFPTDTVFGIGCDPFNKQAVENLFTAKNRPIEKSIPVLIDSIETAKQLANISPECEALLQKYWPGALTVVVPTATPFAENVIRDNTVALRMPDHEDLLELITHVGGALAATSANISNKPPLTTYDEAYAQFAETAAVVLPGSVQGGVSSTVVDCTATPFKTLREGPISVEKS